MNAHRLSGLLLVWLLPLTSRSAMTTGRDPPTSDPQLTTRAAHPGSGPPQSEENTTLKRWPQTSTTALQTEAPATFSTQLQRHDPTPAGQVTAGQGPGTRDEVSARPSTPETSTETGPSTDASTASGLTDATSTLAAPLAGTTAVVPTTTPPTRATTKAGVPATAPSRTAPRAATRPQKEEAPPGKKVGLESRHAAVVSWVIGGTLVLMLLSFLLIYLKKRKLKEQQMTTKDWAGPSPFIEKGEDDGQDAPRSSHRISLSSFLPRPLSRRLSLLPEVDEELVDINPGTTFGDGHGEAPSAQQGAGQVEERPVPGTTPSTKPQVGSLAEASPPNGVGDTAQG